MDAMRHALAILRQGPDCTDRLQQLGGVPVEDLVADHGTPTFVYDSAVAVAQADAVRAAFGAEVDLLFALKANPCLALAAELAGAGLGAEVASAGEVLLARAAGFSLERVQFAGPGKSREDLEQALAAGVGTINLESLGEIEVLGRLAAAAGRRQRVALRVQSGRSQGGSRLRMTGAEARFGIDRELLGEAAARVGASEELELCGLHCYSASQAFDAAAWLDSARDLLACAEHLEGQIGQPLPQLNFGGGFGVATFAGDPSFDLEQAGAGLQRLLAGSGRSASLELGRYLVAPAGVYLCRVLGTKGGAAGGERHVVLDGGLHHLALAAGFGSVLRRSPLVALAAAAAGSSVDSPQPLRQVLSGPLCTPSDTFGAHELPPLAVGDVVAVLVAGAYGLSFSPIRFLGHPQPAEVLVTADGRAHRVRERGRPADILAGQRLPPSD